MEFRTNVIGAK